MRPPDLLYRASRLRATGRLVVAHHSQHVWWRYVEGCERFEAFARGLAESYKDLWRKGPRWWAPALALAPVAVVAAVVLGSLAAVARGIGALGAGLLLVLAAAALIAPVLGAVWALTSFAGQDAGAETARAAQACDPSYPEFCIATGSADLDCPLGGASPPHAPASNFVVRGPDVHVLDGDGDGTGCESSSPAAGR